MIFEVGHLGDSTASKVIDVTGLTIVPGFIDAHVHGDLMLLADPIHLPALRQGVTTYIIGQDGSSFAPGSASTIDYMRRYTAGFNGNPSIRSITTGLRSRSISPGSTVKSRSTWLT